MTLTHLRLFRPHGYRHDCHCPDCESLYLQRQERIAQWRESLDEARRIARAEAAHRARVELALVLAIEDLI